MRPSRDIWHAAAFLAPFVAFNLLFLVYPFGRGVWMSLHDWELLGPVAGIEPVYRGLANYVALFRDPMFWSSLLHTLEFMAMAVPAITGTALLLALALNQPGRSVALMRGIFFVSGVFSVSVVTLIWLIMLNPSRGLVGHVAHVAGWTPVDVLADRRLAMPALVLTTLWWSVGLPMALFLAALQHIPREVYEAAQLDHAGAWARFRRITLPAIRRTVWLVLILEVVLQVQVFGQVLLMTRGGPANSTRVLVQYMYETSFRDWQVGYASALAIVLFAVMMLVSLLQWRILRTQEGRP